MTYYEIKQAENGNNYYAVADKFPNGFTSWQETHFEIVRCIVENSNDDTNSIALVMSMEGTGGLYELAETLTDDFETLHKGKDWDGEFFDAIETFLNNRLNLKHNEGEDTSK